MNYFGIIPADIANGVGFRVSLFVSGCTVGCPGCHNPEAQNFCYGREFDDDAKENLIRLLDKPWVKGLTLTGGHPLEKDTIEDVSKLVFEIKDRFPEKDIWMYTGWTLSYEEIARSDLLKACDVMVDGPYVENLRDVSLAFRGSSNQRIIDVKQTINDGKIVEVKTFE